MDVIAAIYDAVDDDEVFADLPRLFAAAGKGRSCILQTFAHQTELIEGRFSYFTEDMFKRYVELQLFRLDPWRPTATRAEHINRLLAFDDAVPATVLANSGFYHDNFKYWGDDTARCLGGAFVAGGHLNGIGIHRGLRDRPFSVEDVATVGALVPHFTRMTELRARLGVATMKAALSETALNEQTDAVFIVDEAARPLLMNRQAEALVSDQDALTISRTALTARDERAARELAAAIAMACARQQVHGGALQAPRAVGQPLRVLVSPVSAGGLTRALVVVNDPGRIDPDRVEVLRALYALSIAEAETAVALAEDLSPFEVANQRGVSMPTVRAQIRAVLAKTEARGIPALVALVASLPSRAPRCVEMELDASKR
jgi:DNA-binding CsgD family transcriptional regulator